MYNRYFGNTGRYVRVEDVDDLRPNPPVIPVAPSEPPPVSPALEPTPPVDASVWRTLLSGLGSKGESAAVKPAGEKPKFDFGVILDAPASLRGTLKDRLPEAIDFGDILLVLVLLYLFLEEGEDEMLLVLGVLIFLWVWPLFGKEDS